MADAPARRASRSGVGIPYTPRTFQHINADIVQNVSDVTQLLKHLKNKVASKAIDDDVSEASNVKSFDNRLTGTNCFDDDGTVLVGGRRMKEQDVNECRNPETRVEARIIFSRSKKNMPDLGRLSIPLCNSKSELLTRVDPDQLRIQCCALNQFGRSQLSDVMAAFTRKQNENKRSGASLPPLKSASSTNLLPGGLYDGSMKPEHTQSLNYPVNYLRRNKSEKALKQLLPHNRLEQIQRTVQHREEIAADVYNRRYEMHCRLQARSLHSYSQDLGGAMGRNASVRRSGGTDWKTNINVILWAAKLHCLLSNSFAARARYAIERQWMLPVRVWQWCRRTRRKARLRRHWAFLWKFIRVLRVLYRQRRRHTAANTIRIYMENVINGKELKMALHRFKKKILLIQSQYRSFNNHVLTQLRRIHVQFQAQELRYLFHVFHSCPNVDIVVVDNGSYLDDKKTQKQAQKPGKKWQSKIPKDLLPHGEFPPHVLEKLRGTIERHRIKDDVRNRALRMEYIRRLRLDCLHQCSAADGLFKQSQQMRDWIKFAILFDLLEDKSIDPSAMEGNAVMHTASATNFSTDSIFEIVKAMHMVFGVTPHATRSWRMHEEFFKTDNVVRTEAENRLLKESIIVMGLIKNEKATHRHLIEVFEADTTPEVVVDETLPEAPEKDILASQPTNLGACFLRAEASLEKAFREEETAQQQLQEPKFDIDR